MASPTISFGFWSTSTFFYGCAVGKKWLWFGFAKKLRFSVWLQVYKINRVFDFFGSVRPTIVCRRWHHLSFTSLRYGAINDVLPCWIGPINCQPKWLRTRSAEIRHEEKYFDCRSYHAARWIVNETTWKTVPNRQSQFFETELQKPSCQFLPARRYARAGLCDSDVSVRPSVTRWYCA